MGPPQRVRYNEKARQSKAGGPTRKRRRVGVADGSNIEIILPQEAKEEKARREALVCKTNYYMFLLMSFSSEKCAATSQTNPSRVKKRKENMYKNDNGKIIPKKKTPNE